MALRTTRFVQTAPAIFSPITETELDKSKTYILGCISNGLVQNLIEFMSPSFVSRNDRWSHVALLYFDSKKQYWNVIESHYHTGVVEVPLSEWKKQNIDKLRIEIIDYELDVSLARQHLGGDYGTRDIFWYAIVTASKYYLNPFNWFRKNNDFESVMKKEMDWQLFVQPDRPGEVCSSLLSIADKNNRINEFKGYYSLTGRKRIAGNNEIKPNDFKEYAKHLGKKIKVLSLSNM